MVEVAFLKQNGEGRTVFAKRPGCGWKTTPLRDPGDRASVNLEMVVFGLPPVVRPHFEGNRKEWRGACRLLP